MEQLQTYEMKYAQRERFWQAKRAAILEKGYHPDEASQKRVFDRIDWSTFEKEATKEGMTPKQVRGKMFEMLIQADPKFGERSPLERELLALAHSPEKFGLEDELGGYRNPDMAFLLFEGENGVELVGVGESKLGLLNERSFKQLSETGFTKGAQKLIEVVNALPDPESYGLIESAKARPIRIASDFTQLLVVPANRNIEWKSTLINRREFSEEGRYQFYKLLENTQKVRTAKAAFSTAEIAAMEGALRNRT